MSAYIVDRNHIVYLVTAAMSRRLNPYGGNFSWYRFDDENDSAMRGELSNTDYRHAVEVSNMLWNENIRSVAYRYDDPERKDLPGPIGEKYQITLHDFNGTVFAAYDPVQVLKACDCYDYQSCEHPGWRKSEAKAFIDSLRARAWHGVPGYETAQWGAPKPSGAQNLCAMMFGK